MPPTSRTVCAVCCPTSWSPVTLCCSRTCHTPNGKMDRNALPSLGDLAGRRDSASPAAEASNETERLVLSVSETLGRSGIGIDDNFFDMAVIHC